MNKVEKIYLGILKGLGWGILAIVLCAILVICLPIIGAVLIIAGPPHLVRTFIGKYRTKRFLRKRRGKTMLLCTDGKFYYNFVDRNRGELDNMVDQVVYIGKYLSGDYKEVEWKSIIDMQGGFPIVMKIGKRVESRNLKKDFFRYGRGAANEHFMQVLNTNINELKANKKVL